MKTEVSNILSVFEQATPQEKAHGLDWYFYANKEARDLAKEFATPVPTVAGVIAALSPNQRFETNLKSARAVLDAHNRGLAPQEITIPAYNLNKEKAFALCRGGERSQYLRGEKVNCFYKNIVAPWSSNSVTVDGHAYAIWLGERVTMKEVPTRISRPKWYKIITQDYRDAAKDLGLRPWQVQATTWVAWKRMHEVN
jgi:hypothetical protein